MMQKPDVDQIDGLSPAISIEQKTTSKNPRSTVGTVTEIYDYMRLLWARVGVPYSPATGLPIESQTVSQMVDRVLALPEGTRLYHPGAGRARPQGRVRKELAELRRRASSASRSTAVLRDRRSAGARQEVQARHRRRRRPHRRAPDLGRASPTVLETALKLADGIWPSPNCRQAAAAGRTGKDSPTSREERNARAVLFSEKFACPVSGFTIPEIEPRLFSFNNPFGACPTCDGLGVQQKPSMPTLIVPDKELTLRRAPSRPGPSRPRPITTRRWKRSASIYGFKLGAAGSDLPKKAQDAILHGTGENEDQFSYADGLRSYKTTKKPFEGVITNLERRWKETDSAWAREEIGASCRQRPARPATAIA
jgi:excinuclease ABC subunit A